MLGAHALAHWWGIESSHGIKIHVASHNILHSLAHISNIKMDFCWTYFGMENFWNESCTREGKKSRDKSPTMGQKVALHIWYPCHLNSYLNMMTCGKYQNYLISGRTPKCLLNMACMRGEGRSRLPWRRVLFEGTPLSGHTTIRGRKEEMWLFPTCLYITYKRSWALGHSDQSSSFQKNLFLSPLLI